MTHRDPSVRQVEAVSLPEDAGERKSILTGDLTGGELHAGDLACAQESQLEGGLERPVDGHGTRNSGVHTLISAS